MKTPKSLTYQHVTRARIGAILVWVLWIANAAVDIVERGALSPLTFAILVGLLVGQVLLWLRIVPNPMPASWSRALLAIIAIVVFGYAGYVVLRLA